MGFSSACQVWHSVTREAPLHPFRLLKSDCGELKTDSGDNPASNDLKDVFKQIRLERMSFKNMQIHLHDLSAFQSMFDDSRVLKQRDDGSSAKLKDEWSRSSMTFEFPSDSAPWSSSSLTPSALSSTSVSNHKLFNNCQHIPMAVSKYVFSLVAEHTGLKVSELNSTTRFEEIGLDSLLAISVISQLREEGLQLPMSIFWDFPTVKELETFLDGT